jgi:hypothetical protein
MKPRLSDSPTKLAVLAALGGPIACALPLLLGPLNHSWLFGPYMLFCIVVASVCAILPLKFVTDLRHGVEDERWTEAQLEPLRALLQSRYYTALSVAPLVAFFIFEFATKQSSLGLGGACLFFLEIILYQLRFALKRPPSSTPPNQWRNSSPVHSDHSGHR